MNCWQPKWIHKFHVEQCLHSYRPAFIFKCVVQAKSLKLAIREDLNNAIYCQSLYLHVNIFQKLMDPTINCSLNYEFNHRGLILVLYGSIHENYKLRTCCVHKLFWMSKQKTICVHNMFWACSLHILNW